MVTERATCRAVIVGRAEAVAYSRRIREATATGGTTSGGLTDSAVVNTEREVAMRVEEHEAAAWIHCATAASSLPGNPLKVVIDRSGPTPRFAMCAVDRWDLNRVVALGMPTDARPEDIDAICSFYRMHGQQHFRIEVTPFARPSNLAASIAARGLKREAPRTFKLWRPASSPDVPRQDVDVRRLGPADSDAIAALNIVAWGAWNTPILRAWFRATVGRAGVQHYGVFDGDRLVATGALFVSDGVGWVGFDATHPRYQARALRQAISAVRLRDAEVQGCDIVHAESAIVPRPRAYRDGWRLLYEKHNYDSMPHDNELAPFETEVT